MASTRIHTACVALAPPFPAGLLLAALTGAAAQEQLIALWTFDTATGTYINAANSGANVATASAVTALGSVSVQAGGQAGFAFQSVSLTTSWPAQGTSNATAGGQVSTAGRWQGWE